MNIYIQIENGQPINHPAFEDNLMQAFGCISTNWELFLRVERPFLDIYQVLNTDTPSYQKIDGVWTDVWTIRDMTDAEKKAKQEIEKNFWLSLPNRDNFSTWTFDENKCAYVAPVPMPTDGQDYFWQGTTNSWKIEPPYPTDDKQYKFDVASATWVEQTT